VNGPWRCWLRGSACHKKIELWTCLCRTPVLSLNVLIREFDIGRHIPFLSSLLRRILYPVPLLIYPQNRRAVINMQDDKDKVVLYFFP
jgi:hypothetical protein